MPTDRRRRLAVAADAVGGEPHPPLGEQLAEGDLPLLVVLDVEDAALVVGV